MKQPNNKPKKSVYEIITDKIIEKLKQGCVPWQKSWHVSPAANYISGKAYRGFNALILNCNTYKQPYYMTYKQNKQLGGYIEKGAEPDVVMYWKKSYFDIVSNKKLTEQEAFQLPLDRVETKSMLRYYLVYNVEHVKDVDFTFATDKAEKPEKIQACEGIVNNMNNKPSIKYKGGRACYDPIGDTVLIPYIDHFYNAEEYYSTLFHELVHATGHKNRLDREGIVKPVRYGSETYSEEELIAEIGSCFICNEAGILKQTFENSAAYIQGWLEALQNDPKMIIQASSKAQKSADFILGRSW